MDRWLAYADTLIATAVRREGERREFARQARVAALDLQNDRMEAALDRLEATKLGHACPCGCGRMAARTFEQKMEVGQVPGTAGWLRDPDVSKAAAREDQEVRQRAALTENADISGYRVPPVEVDELANDRAEQLAAALTTALLGYFPHQNPLYAVLDDDAVARGLLNHPYVRDALKPARAVVWAEPVGTVVSLRYLGEGGVHGRASHLTVALDPGVAGVADMIGKKVAVAK